MTNLKNILEAIKQNNLFSEEEKQFWLNLVPSFDQAEQTEFYNTLLKSTKGVEKLKAKYNKTVLAMKQEHAKEWQQLVKEENRKTSAYAEKEIKKHSDSKIKQIRKDISDN